MYNVPLKNVILSLSEFKTQPLKLKTELRREGDSNPRYPFEYASLANWWIQPLSHLSFGYNPKSKLQDPSLLMPHTTISVLEVQK